MWQERGVKPDTHVLVATQAAMQSAWLAKTLRDADYSVLLAADTTVALKTIRASAKPLIVVVDASNTRLLNSIVSSRRLIHHHVYVLITPELLQHTLGCVALYARLTHFIVRVPLTRDHLLEVMAQASRCLGSAYPVASATENTPKASLGSTDSYNDAGADRALPIVPTPDDHRDDHDVPP